MPADKGEKGDSHIHSFVAAGTQIRHNIRRVSGRVASRGGRRRRRHGTLSRQVIAIGGHQRHVTPSTQPNGSIFSGRHPTGRFTSIRPRNNSRQRQNVTRSITAFNLFIIRTTRAHPNSIALANSIRRANTRWAHIGHRQRGNGKGHERGSILPTTMARHK